MYENDYNEVTVLDYCGRLTYAGLAKGYTLLPGVTAKSAVEFRNNLKAAFRLGVGRNWRAKSYQYFKMRKISDPDIIRSAGRTNPFFNVYGAGLFVDGIYDEE